MLFLFAWEKLPPEIVAFLGVTALTLAKVIEPSEAFAHFSNPAILAIGALFALGSAVERSGIISKLAIQITRLTQGTSTTTTIFIFAIGIAALSAFVNNTPLVLLLIPVAKQLAVQRKVPASKLLIPLSYAAILGGLCTVIGTSTNLVVNSIAHAEKIPPIRFFEIAWVGVPIALCGCLYLATIGQSLLPSLASKPILETDGDSPPPFNIKKAITTLGLLAAAILFSSLGILPLHTAAITAILAAILLRCISVNQVYRSLHMPTLFLVVAMLGVGTAMEKSGATNLIAETLKNVANSSTHISPAILLLVCALLATTLLTEILSNTASAVLMGYIVIDAALTLGLDTKPFLIAVAIAASASFATPIGYQTNTFVYQAGGYQFRDFLKIGIPLNVLVVLLALTIIPIVWPL